MKRGSFFSVTKERREPKKLRSRGVTYRKGSYKDNQYVFFQPSESDDEVEEIFVLQAKKKEEKFVVRVLQPGDTLPNIAVQYGYSVEELKRINHIHKDNEIFARTTLKVPMRIMETAPVHNVAKDAEDSSMQAKIHEDVESVNHIRTVSISDAYRASKQEGSDAEAARRFLASMDRDLARIRESASSFKERTNTYDFSLTEVGEALTGPFPPSAKDKADSNLNWVRLLICSLFLGFIAPIIYVIYRAEEPSKRP